MDIIYKGMCMEYKKGDTVNIKTFEVLKQEFGLNDNGDAKVKYLFTTQMNALSGKQKIISVDKDKIKLEGFPDFNISEDMISEKINTDFDDIKYDTEICKCFIIDASKIIHTYKEKNYMKKDITYIDTTYCVIEFNKEGFSEV